MKFRTCVLWMKSGDSFEAKRIFKLWKLNIYRIKILHYDNLKFIKAFWL